MQRCGPLNAKAHMETLVTALNPSRLSRLKINPALKIGLLPILRVPTGSPFVAIRCPIGSPFVAPFVRHFRGHLPKIGAKTGEILTRVCTSSGAKTRKMDGQQVKCPQVFAPTFWHFCTAGLANTSDLFTLCCVP